MPTWRRLSSLRGSEAERIRRLGSLRHNQIVRPHSRHGTLRTITLFGHHTCFAKALAKISCWNKTPVYVPSYRYPTPCTVVITDGDPGSGSTFLRSCAMCWSSVRVVP